MQSVGQTTRTMEAKPIAFETIPSHLRQWFEITTTTYGEYDAIMAVIRRGDAHVLQYIAGGPRARSEWTFKGWCTSGMDMAKEIQKLKHAPAASVRNAREFGRWGSIFKEEVDF